MRVHLKVPGWLSDLKALLTRKLPMLLSRLNEISGGIEKMWERGGLMVRVLDSGLSGPGSGPGWGHCVVFLGKTLYSHGSSLHPGV